MKKHDRFLLVSIDILTITTNFQFAYDNKEEWWAKKTLAGLNKVYNLKQIMKKGGENKKREKLYHLTMEMLNNNISAVNRKGQK